MENSLRFIVEYFLTKKIDITRFNNVRFTEKSITLKGKFHYSTEQLVNLYWPDATTHHTKSKKQFVFIHSADIMVKIILEIHPE